MNALDGPPRVSVVIPVKNGERYLAEAIESIRGQALPSLEIVVVDDGSTDGTRRIVERAYPACRYHYQETAGPAAARNMRLFAKSVMPELKTFDAGAAIDRSQPLPDLRYAVAAE